MHSPRHVADGIWMLRTTMVNVFFVGVDDGWVLVDAGLPGSTSAMRHAATELFGLQPPRAIVLTHGHFDHVGALSGLLDAWDVPVYAHPFELPHLTDGVRLEGLYELAGILVGAKRPVARSGARRANGTAS